MLNHLYLMHDFCLQLTHVMLLTKQKTNTNNLLFSISKVFSLILPYHTYTLLNTSVHIMPTNFIIVILCYDYPKQHTHTHNYGFQCIEN